MHNSTITDAVRVFAPAVIAFVIGMLITPVVSKYLYKWQLWKKTSVAATAGGGSSAMTQAIHNDAERKVPRMGGSIVWLSTFLTILVTVLIASFFPGSTLGGLNFLSRNQTWLPAFTLLLGALVGLIDDFQVVKGTGTYSGGGLSLKRRLLFIILLGALGGFWFYFKLGITSIHIPFDGSLNFGIFFIPFFIVVMLAVYSGGIIDGIDGLAGGIFTIMFSAYAIISYSRGLVDIAAFCMVIVGSLLVFLWFNIPPARFFLSETGTMALTTTLTVIAFLTGEVVILPIIAFPLVITTASAIIQILSKKWRNGKRVFLVAPLHNHYIQKGWPAHKVTMRYWIFAVMCAVAGIIFALIS